MMRSCNEKTEVWRYVTYGALLAGVDQVAGVAPPLHGGQLEGDHAPELPHHDVHGVPLRGRGAVRVHLQY